MGINAKEAENVGFAREVIALLPEFLDRPNVLGIGEIGLHKCTRNEVTTLAGADRPGPVLAASRCSSTRRTWRTSTRARG